MGSIFVDGNGVRLDGDLIIPDLHEVMGIIIFAHGSGSDKNSPRNQYIQNILNDAGFATLLINLLIPEEQDEDAKAQNLPIKSQESS